MALGFFCSLVSFLVYFDSLFILWGVPLVFLFFFTIYGGFSDGVFFVDFITLVLLFVTVWIFVFSIMSISLSSYSFLVLWLLFSFLFFWLMFSFLIFRFLSSNYILFYVTFEFVFVLIFTFLLGWGKTAERLQASFYIFFYTIIFSLPFLVLLVDCFYGFSGSFYSLSF